MHVLVVGAATVDDPVVGDLNDAVGHRLGELVVVAGENDVVLEGLKAVVERGNALEVEVVRRLVEQEKVRAREHHAAEHASDLLTAGEDAHALVHVVAGEEHTAQKAAQITLALVLRELAHPVDEVKVAVKIAVVILGEIAWLNARAPLDRAGVRLLLAHEDFIEHRHGELVFPDEGDLVVLADKEAHVVEELHAVHGLGDLGNKEAVLARLAVGLEADPGVAAVGGGQLLHGDLVQQLPARGRLPGFGLVGGDASNEGLQLLDLLLGLLVLILDELLDELAGFVPEVVVADVHLDLAVVDVHDVRADVVEKIAVMAHDEDGALVIHEKVLQPHHTRKVEVVGRLVEQDHVRVAEESLSQQHLDLDAGVGVAHEISVQRHVHAETLEDAPGVALGLPAAELGEFLLQLGGADPVRVVKVWLFIEGVLLLAAFVEAGIAHDDRVEHGIVVVEALVLLEHRHAALGVEHDAAAGGLELAGENFDKGGLARAVGPDNAVAVARRELQIHAGEEHGRPELDGEIVDCQHSLLLYIILYLSVALSIKSTARAVNAGLDRDLTFVV